MSRVRQGGEGLSLLCIRHHPQPIKTSPTALLYVQLHLKLNESYRKVKKQQFPRGVRRSVITPPDRSNKRTVDAITAEYKRYNIIVRKHLPFTCSENI